jgi:flagellar hook-associated protein FlgK
MVDKLNLVDPAHLQADIVNSALTLTAAGGYKFDFRPVLTSDDSGLTAAGAPTVTAAGAYTGEGNQVYTVTAEGTGAVGVTDGLTLKVEDATGAIVTRVNVGAGYAAGDAIDLVEGMSLSLTPGDLNAGDEIKLTARSDTDTSGFLAAAGVNTFFAVSVGLDTQDNLNAARMGELGETALDALGEMSPGDFFRQMYTKVGQDVLIRTARRDGLEKVRQQLGGQRDAISGVDINTEAAKLMMFEKMFTAMAKFFSVQERSFQTLVDLIGI